MRKNSQVALDNSLLLKKSGKVTVINPENFKREGFLVRLKWRKLVLTPLKNVKNKASGNFEFRLTPFTQLSISSKVMSGKEGSVQWFILDISDLMRESILKQRTSCSLRIMSKGEEEIDEWKNYLMYNTAVIGQQKIELHINKFMDQKAKLEKKHQMQILKKAKQLQMKRQNINIEQSSIGGSSNGNENMESKAQYLRAISPRGNQLQMGNNIPSSIQQNLNQKLQNHNQALYNEDLYYQQQKQLKTNLSEPLDEITTSEEPQEESELKLKEDVQSELLNTLTETYIDRKMKSPMHHHQTSMLKAYGYILRKNFNRFMEGAYQKPSIVFGVLSTVDPKNSSIVFYKSHTMKKIAEVISCRVSLSGDEDSIVLSPLKGNLYGFTLYSRNDDQAEVFIASDKVQRDTWIQYLQEVNCITYKHVDEYEALSQEEESEDEIDENSIEQENEHTSSLPFLDSGDGTFVDRSKGSEPVGTFVSKDITTTDHECSTGTMVFKDDSENYGTSVFKGDTTNFGTSVFKDDNEVDTGEPDIFGKRNKNVFKNDFWHIEETKNKTPKDEENEEEGSIDPYGTFVQHKSKTIIEENATGTAIFKDDKQGDNKDKLNVFSWGFDNVNEEEKYGTFVEKGKQTNEKSKDELIEQLRRELDELRMRNEELENILKEKDETIEKLTKQAS